MITKEKISELVSEKLENDMFLVDINVSPSHVIHVEIESMNGISVGQCVAVSRHIESHFDREKEDFELQVSSPGIGQDFKVTRQYLRNVGRELDVVTTDGKEMRGKLLEAVENGFVLEVTEKVKKDGEKKKQVVTNRLSFGYEEIKKAKVVISFK